VSSFNDDNEDRQDNKPVPKPRKRSEVIKEKYSELTDDSSDSECEFVKLTVDSGDAHNSETHRTDIETDTMNRIIRTRVNNPDRNSTVHRDETVHKDTGTYEKELNDI
jgi:hypothetical protein